MVVDSFILIILVFTIIQGYRTGFVFTFIHTVGWILAIIMGFVWYPHVINFLKDKTDYYDFVNKTIADKASESADAQTSVFIEGLPDVLKDLTAKAMSTATDAIANSVAINLSNLIFNIIGFLIVAICIKLILLFVTSLFSKKSNDGFIGGIDGFFGLIAGALKGAIIVFIILAVLVPVTALSGGGIILESIEGSVVGSYLYDNNLIFLIVRRIL